MKWPKPEHKYGYTQAQLKEICKIEKISKTKFNKAFGVNTCALDKKLGVIYYYYDVERAVEIARDNKFKSFGWD